MTANYQLLQGDCVEVMRQLEPGCVQTCITSPPYWNLRDYGVEGQIGLEATPAEYIAKMVAVFREVRRLLRDDGTLWLNLGDSYANDGKHGGKSGNMHAYLDEGSKTRAGREKRSTGLPPKSMVGIPWRVAFALQDDGWILRQDIIWHKPNPMPSSVEDRCTTAHEYIFLLAKKPLYFYDHEAIKEPSVTSDMRRPYGSAGAWDLDGRPSEQRHGGEPRSSRDSFKREGSKREQMIPGQAYGTHRPDREESAWDVGSRNKRSVWTVSPTGFPGAHFATFPPELIEPCVLAGTSGHGCCSECGAPWERIVEKEFIPQKDVVDSRRKAAGPGVKGPDASSNWDGVPRGINATTTTGWKPTCTCNAAVMPCTVLDPFIGSGTTAAVALQHHRRCIGIDLNPGYLELAHDRIRKTQPVLLAVNP